MKRKHIRTIAIAALVLLIAVTAVMRIEIEPANPAEPTPTATSQNTGMGENGLGTETPYLPALPEVTPDMTDQNELPQPTPGEMPPPETMQQVDITDVPEAEPTPEPVPREAERHICTISIRCDTVTDTANLENPAAAPFVPADGVIMGTTEMEFTPGESVFDILLRATRDKNIHLEFRDDNLYSGKYVEGINYLYVLDAGPLSGWMYQVNGQFPSYGCAACTINDGDAIVWLYTCDLGTDVGDNSIW